MTITPEQAKETNKRNNKGKIETLEKKIDKILVDNINSCNRREGIIVGVSTLELGDLFEFIKERYEDAGWALRYESDQRDGDYYVFTPKRRVMNNYAGSGENSGGGEK